MKNINLSSSPVRPDNFTRNDADNNGPGQYNHERSFGQDVKSYKIGEKRPARHQEGMGPGAYDPDRADSQTKPKMPNINMGQSPSRPASFAVGDPSIGPGQYNDGRGPNTKSFRIGEKSPERKPDSVLGPGHYSPERADSLTKNKIPNINLGSSPSRPASFAAGGDPNNGPGSLSYDYGYDSKGFTIGVKRPE